MYSKNSSMLERKKSLFVNIKNKKILMKEKFHEYEKFPISLVILHCDEPHIAKT